VVFADRGVDPADAAEFLAKAGFAGIMLDIAEPAAGGLLRRLEIAALSGFVRRAKALGAACRVCGRVGGAGRSAPASSWAPDFLGFDISARDEAAATDAARMARIRALIPRPKGVAAMRSRSDLERATQTVAQRIFVRDLVLPVRIGAYSDERAAPQKVRFNVSVDLDPRRGEPTGMGQVLSYDLVTDGIASIVAEGHIDFAETLAQRIATLILRQPRARRVSVTVEKLERGPAIFGVEIVAERAAEPEEDS
jgi:dihydroneopterin aldolase